MMYPYMTLSDGTEIVHSHLITEKNPPEIEANFECPIDDGLKSARFKYAVNGRIQIS